MTYPARINLFLVIPQHSPKQFKQVSEQQSEAQHLHAQARQSKHNVRHIIILFNKWIGKKE